MRKKLVLPILTMLLIIPTILVHAELQPVHENGEREELEGETTSKDEVVYATLSATGEVENVYVVNILEVERPGKIIDYGFYTDIINLTDLSDIKQEEEVIAFSASSGKFYYQGNMSNVELPWNIQLSYWLNGKEIIPEELAGKDGDFKLKITTSANKNGQVIFYENYLLQISLMLDFDIFSHILAPEGLISNVGKNQQITFTVLPEQEAELILSAKVINFELQGVEIAAIPSTLSVDAPDIEEMTGEMRTLADAMEEIHDGVKELHSGISQLNDGLTDLESGSTQFLKGFRELINGSLGLSDASEMINDSLTLLSNSLQHDSTSMDMSQLSQLALGLSDLALGIDEMSDGLLLLHQSYSIAYSTLDEAMLAIPDYHLSEEEIYELYSSITDHDILDKLLETYSAANTAKGTYLAVKEGFETVDYTLYEMSGSLKEIADILFNLSQELSTSLENMEDFNALVLLEEGLKDLSIGYEEFHTGLLSYMDGVTQMANSYDELHSGLDKLGEGTGELDQGAGQLSDGTHELYEATNDLPDQMKEEVDKMIADMDKSDFEPVSFVSLKNSKINSVQFVMKTERIKREKKESLPLEEEKAKGFWARLLQLFKW